MTIKKFLNLIKELNIRCLDQNYQYSDKINKDHYIYKKWTTGGKTGGGYWGEPEGGLQPVTADPEPEFDDLNQILGEICPQITFLQYKLLNKIAERRDSRGYSDYYGNYDEYTRITIKIEDLYNKLKEMGLFND